MQRQLSTSEMPIFPGEEQEDDLELEAKLVKAPAVRSSWAATERSVHLVPLLTVLCFVVLFLCSHAPSPSDMASFGGKAVGSRKPKSL